jgi:hypothetical protein
VLARGVAGCAIGLLLLSASGCVQAKGVVVSRAGMIQATGKTQAIWKRVREIEQAACQRQMVSQAECAKADQRDAEMRKMFREVDAAVLVPGYELDWRLILRTLETIGDVLDVIPFP